jgi:hypothetical protein
MKQADGETTDLQELSSRLLGNSDERLSGGSAGRQQKTDIDDRPTTLPLKHRVGLLMLTGGVLLISMASICMDKVLSKIRR